MHPVAPDDHSLLGARQSGYMLAVVAVALSAAAYWPILGNYLFLDDFFYFYLLRTESIASFILTPWFGHLFAFRNLLFTLFFDAFGTDPRGYFCVILLTHLVNVALLFRVICLQAGSVALACFGATLWGVSALHAETLGWLSVYGHCLVALLLLAILSGVARPAATRRDVPRWVPLLWGVALICAATSYGTGLAIAIVFPLVLLLMMPPGGGRQHLGFFAGVALFAVVTWCVGNVFRSAADPSPSLWDAGPIGGQMRSALTMIVHLFLSGLGGLLTNAVSAHSTLSTRSAVVATLATVGLAAILIGAPASMRRIACAWLLVTFAAYGSIAVGRGALFALLPQQGVLVPPRYQYVATIGLTVIVCLGLAELARRMRLRGRARTVLLGAWLIWVGASLWYAPPPINSHSRDRDSVAGMLAEIARQSAAVPPGHMVFVENRRLRPGWAPTDFYAGTFVVFFDGDRVDGRPVRFVSTRETIEAARRHPTLRTLLVSREDALAAGWRPSSR